MATAAYSTLYLDYISSFNTATRSQLNILNTSGTPSNYQLAYGGWSPNVSQRKTNLLSGSVSYTPVEEELTLNVVSAVSAADCTNKLQTLLNVLDKADRWADNQLQPAVRLFYLPKGSTKTLAYNSLIISNHSSINWADLPVTYDDVGAIYRINGVKIKFLRLGLWFQSDTSDTAAGASTQAAFTGTLTLSGTASPIPSPIDLSFGSFVTTTMPVSVPVSYLLFGAKDASSNAQRVNQVTCSIMATGAYTSVNDAARQCPVTNVLRYTPAGITSVDTLAVSLGVVSGNNFAIFGLLRNNSTTTTFSVKVNLISANAANAATNKSTSQVTLIDASIQTPRVVFLGTVQRVTVGSLRLFLSTQASAASGSLDFSQLFVAEIDDELTSIIEIAAFNMTNEVSAGSYQIGIFANQGDYAIGNPYSGILPIQPEVTFGTGAVYARLQTIGNLPIVTDSNTVNYIWLCVAAGGADRWVYVDNANAIVTPAMSITARHSAFLIPE
jgi:hypothetical protein